MKPHGYILNVRRDDNVTLNYCSLHDIFIPVISVVRTAWNKLVIEEGIEFFLKSARNWNVRIAGALANTCSALVSATRPFRTSNNN